MIELALAGAALLGFLGAGLFERHHRAIVAAAIYLQNGQPKLADGHLDLTLAIPALPWQRNHQALCLNLQAYAKLVSGQRSGAEEVCEKLLGLKNVAVPIHGLVYHRLAELAMGTDAAAYQTRGEEIWYEGYEELGRLKLWEELGYFFWGLNDHVKAGYCFDRALENDWKSQSLYLRYHCYAQQDIDTEALLRMAQVAYDNNKNPMQRAALLTAISDHYHSLGRYEEAYQATQRCLKLAGKHFSKSFAYRLSVRQLRALGRYQEAAKVREEWFDSLGPEDLLVMLGQLHDDGEYQHCLELLHPYLHTGDSGLRYALGTVYLELGNPGEAIPHLKAALDLTFQPSPTANLVRAYLLTLQRGAAEECLIKLPPGEVAWGQGIRKELAYYWDGNPEAAQRFLEPGKCDLAGLLYRGEFDSLLEAGLERYGKELDGAPPELKEARLSFHRAMAHHWAERHREALVAYSIARQSFLNSPCDRDRSALYALECQAFLGQDVEAEFQELARSMRVRFATSTALMREIESVEIDLRLASHRYSEVIPLVNDYLTREQRKFQRAEQLRARALAYLALGNPKAAAQDCLEIMAGAPGSFLAEWAQRQLEPDLKQ